jgi:hypothetical protein
MPDIYMDVDAALSEVPVNLLPLTDDTDFKTRETAVAYNAAGMDLVWNFVTSAGSFTQTAVTPTTAGTYDWTHQGDGMYTIEIPASAGASINNDTEGYGWFTGLATGVLPWRGPVIGFRASGINDILMDSAYSTTRGLAGTALPAAAADAAGGLPISDAGGLDLDTFLGRITGNVALASVLGALNDAAVDGDPTTSDTVMQYIKQLVNTLVGTAGIPTYPSSAAPGNAVSLAEALRQVYDEVAGLNGGAMLDAAGVRSAVGLASANLDTQLGAIDDFLDTEVAAILAASVATSGTADSGTTTTMVDAALTQADTDYWAGNLILFTSGTISGQCRLITAFTPASDTVTFTPATTQAVGTNTYIIIPFGRVNIAQWLGSTPNALQSGRVDSYLGAGATDVITATLIAADAIGSSELAATAVSEIADQVWDEVLSGHLTAGTTGEALNAAGGAGDPWITAVPGAYTAGQAGYILGTNLNATVSSRASHTSLDTMDDYVDTEITTISNRIGSFTGTGVNTILGFFQALMRSDSTTPSDVGGTYDDATDSLQAISDAGGGGTVDANVIEWNGVAIATPHTAGYPVVTVKDGTGTGEINTASGVVEANVASVTAGAITSGSFATSAINAIGDAVLLRDWTAIVASVPARSLLNGARFLRNAWDVTAGVLTVRKEDGTTSAWSKNVTEDANADGITGVDN